MDHLPVNAELVQTVHGSFHWMIIELPDGNLELILFGEV